MDEMELLAPVDLGGEMVKTVELFNEAINVKLEPDVDRLFHPLEVGLELIKSVGALEAVREERFVGKTGGGQAVLEQLDFGLVKLDLERLGRRDGRLVCAGCGRHDRQADRRCE